MQRSIFFCFFVLILIGGGCEFSHIYFCFGTGDDTCSIYKYKFNSNLILVCIICCMYMYMLSFHVDHFLFKYAIHLMCITTVALFIDDHIPCRAFSQELACIAEPDCEFSSAVFSCVNSSDPAPCHRIFSEMGCKVTPGCKFADSQCHLCNDTELCDGRVELEVC